MIARDRLVIVPARLPLAAPLGLRGALAMIALAGLLPRLAVVAPAGALGRLAVVAPAPAPLVAALDRSFLGLVRAPAASACALLGAFGTLCRARVRGAMVAAAGLGVGRQ